MEVSSVFIFLLAVSLAFCDPKTEEIDGLTNRLMKRITPNDNPLTDSSGAQREEKQSTLSRKRGVKSFFKKVSKWRKIKRITE